MVQGFLKSLVRCAALGDPAATTGVEGDGCGTAKASQGAEVSIVDHVVRVATVEARRPVIVRCDPNTYSRLQLVVCSDGDQLLFPAICWLATPLLAFDARCNRSFEEGVTRGNAQRRIFQTHADTSHQQQRLLRVKKIPQLCVRTFQSCSHPVLNTCLA